MLAFGPRSARAWAMAAQGNARRALAQPALQPASDSFDVDSVLDAFQPAAPLVLKYETEQGELYIGVDGPLQQSQPGNGGLRVWRYDSSDAAVAECAVLSSTMTGKHAVYGTGFSGAKLVFNASRPISDLDKRALMRDVATALRGLSGAVYTGCDLNTDLEDMQYLMELSPYVLASVGAPCDPNVATGYGVFGAIQGALEGAGGVQGKSFLVKGTGKVGTVVAQQLVAAGAARVCTFDANPKAADISGCDNVSHLDWADVPCDIFVPCSVSGFIDEEVAASLDCRMVVGASNAPFSSQAAYDVLESRGITFIPESISSAGAVLADSIECFDSAAFRSSRGPLVYAYVRALTSQKAAHFVAEAGAKSALPAMSAVTPPRGSAPVGGGFSSWVRSRKVEVDVAVIGGGMAGAAAAWQLSREAPGLKGVILEATTVAHDRGSSYGQSRMYRQMYSDPYFSVMQSKSLGLWGELEAESGQKLLKQNGLLFYGETDTGETVEGSVPGARAVMDQLRIPYTYYDTAAKMNAKWPMTAPEGYQGIYEETAGSVNSSAACAAMVDSAMRGGNWELRERARVDDVAVVRPGRVEVLTSTGDVVSARKLVVAAGAWTNEVLAHLGHPLELEVHNVQYGHYEVDPQLVASFPQWFCFRKPVPGTIDGGLYYGFPAESATDNIIKVGVDFTPATPRHRTSSMADFNFTPDPEITAAIDSFLAANWRGVRGRRDMFCSPYTMTRDSYFVLDTLPGAEDVSVFTGGNGRAFKFAPLLGRCLADLAMERPASYDIEPLRITRDAVQPAAKQSDGAAAACA